MPATAQELADRLSNVIINPILALLFAVALLVFFWGIFQFIWGSQSETKNEGKMHLLWGILGMFIMVVAYTILRLIQNTVNGF